MIIVINIILLVAIVAFLFRNTTGSPIKNHFFFALSVKLTSGVLLGVVYFYYYGSGDTLVYDEVASYLAQTGSRTFQDLISVIGKIDETTLEAFPILREPRSAFFIKIISVFYIVTSGSYWLTSLYFSLFSFIGSWFLADKIIRFDPAAKIPATVSFLYFPSFVFWSSGILKEPIAWGCLSVIVVFFIVYLQTRKLNFKQSLLGIILLYVLWSIKYHYAAVLALCFFPVLLHKAILPYTKKTGNFYYYILGLSIMLIVLMLSHPNFQPGRIMIVIQENHELIKQISGPGKSIQFIEMNNPYLKFLANLPVSLFGGLFMPLPWQGVNVLILGTGILNFILLLLFIGKLSTLSLKEISQIPPWKLSMAFYIIILAILMAYTTPNFGTLERYKTGYIGFFIFWIFYGNPYVTRILKYSKQ